MSNLYHQDIYKFDEPVKSYWEYSIPLGTQIGPWKMVLNSLYKKCMHQIVSALDAGQRIPRASEYGHSE